MPKFSLLSFAALCGLAVAPASAQTAGVQLDCTLTVICLGAAPCREWDQTMTILPPQDDTGEWVIDWPGASSAAYQLVADLPAPEGSLRPARIRTLVHGAEETQAVQIVTLSDIGHIAVTMHQPHLTPPSVTAGGTCPALIPDESTE